MSLANGCAIGLGLTTRYLLLPLDKGRLTPSVQRHGYSARRRHQEKLLGILPPKGFLLFSA